MEKYTIGTLNNISKVGLSRLTDRYELVSDPDQANGIIVRSYKMHDMDFSDQLLAIGRAGAGVNNIPIDRCAEEGIVVFNAPGANSNAVKELVIAGLIMGARNIYEGVSWANTLEEDVAGAVEKGKKQFAGTEISGKTLGVIGLGAIGAKVANVAYALGMNVVGYEAFQPHPCLTAPVTLFDDVSEMVKDCEYVSIHVPSLPATKGMINAELIGAMKDGVIILNYARPDLVVNGDILAGIQSGKIRKYMTDVPNDELVRQPGVVATPHLGASTEEAEDNCAAMVADQLMDYLENGNIVNSVNFPRVQAPLSDGACRISILYKGIPDIEALVRDAAAEGSIVSITVGKSRTEFGAAIIDLKADADPAPILALSAEGILRIRAL